MSPTSAIKQLTVFIPIPFISISLSMYGISASRKRLRYALYEAAISVIGKNREFKEVYDYYRTREKNPLKKMQSVIAVACKLIAHSLFFY